MANQFQANTFVPGMDSNLDGAGNLYSRGGSPQGGAAFQETMVPGYRPVQQTQSNISSDAVKTGVPIVGFLYSISHNGIPEFWPLHLGPNTIGRSADCDIQLKEQTVSSNHAVLSIKQMKSTGRFIAMIRDVGSKSGMFLNDEELDYDNHTCKHEDVITVGENYQLLLLLVDATNYNLKAAENFMPVTEAEQVQAPVQAPVMSPYSRPGHIDDGTVDLSGSNYMSAEGGETRILD